MKDIGHVGNREVDAVSREVEVSVTSLFQPDTLLAAEYFEAFRRKAHLEPEKKLMLTVLDDAIACFRRTILAWDHKGRAVFREAEEWFLEEDGDRLFSFENICDVLRLDAGYIRQHLLGWKRERLTEGSKGGAGVSKAAGVSSGLRTWTAGVRGKGG
jgi:hypothetical protein